MAPTPITTAEAARRLGVSPPTVQKWVDAGTLSAWKTVGGHRRIDAGSVEALRRQRCGPARADGLSVLLVEPDPARAQATRRQILKAEPGARVRVVPDGFEALLSAGRDRPDLMLTDVHLPGLDGPTMVARLLGDPALSAMRIVLVTQADDCPGVPCTLPRLAAPLTAAALREVLAPGG